MEPLHINVAYKVALLVYDFSQNIKVRLIIMRSKFTIGRWLMLFQTEQSVIMLFTAPQSQEADTAFCLCTSE